MNLYFGNVDFDEFDNVDPGDTFEYRGNHYWYKAVIDEDQICFHDTCGRHFPIALENVGEADTVMFAAKTLHEANQEAQRVVERAHTKVASLLNFWDKN